MKKVKFFAVAAVLFGCTMFANTAQAQTKEAAQQSKAELFRFADSLGVSLNSTMSDAEIIERITAAKESALTRLKKMDGFERLDERESYLEGGLARLAGDDYYRKLEEETQKIKKQFLSKSTHKSAYEYYKALEKLEKNYSSYRSDKSSDAWANAQRIEGHEGKIVRLDKTEIDMGTVKAGEEVVFEFNFTSKNDEFTLVKSNSPAGFLVVSVPYGPEKKGTITVKFNTKSYFNAKGAGTMTRFILATFSSLLDGDPYVERVQLKLKCTVE